MNPLAGNPLRSRSDLQRAVVDLVRPMLAHLTRESWIHPAAHGATYTLPGRGVEGFARPLWGLAPLAAGGGRFDHWDQYVRGITAGVDPDSPGFWGYGIDHDQRFVECASLGTALCLAPKQVWEPLSPRAKENLERWLLHINQHTVPPNNWHFFRVLANLGLSRVGARHDRQAVERDFEMIESMYCGDGWYKDGLGPRFDYYTAFALHFYALIYAKVAEADDPERAARFRERAALFARDFRHWFCDDGRALPFGRSQTYRFAQASFWGALAFAGVEALPWGQIKALALRHLRWWATQPIFASDGTLPVGYAYPNLIMSEPYNGPGAPYWAMKFFLPLALPESHPFWQAEETQPPRQAVHKMKLAGMIACHDAATDHLVVLSSGQACGQHVGNMPEKYLKFAYSSHMGFCITRSPYDSFADSMLSLSDDGVHWRMRDKVEAVDLRDGELWSRWWPFSDVEIETRLIPAGAWHVRVHRIRTGRKLWSCEGGFSLSPAGGYALPEKGDVGPGVAVARSADGLSGIRDLDGRRTGVHSPLLANVNLQHPVVIVPALTCELPPGEHVLTCGVTASPSAAAGAAAWASPPERPAS